MRLKFKEWVSLISLYEKLPDIDALIQIVKIGCGEDKLEHPWWEFADIYKEIVRDNEPKRFPLLITKSKKDDKEYGWDYEGRTWYAWVNIIASAYGWTLDYISCLDFDDAIAVIQEILMDTQLKKEWEWQLSEIAYPYNKSTKKSEFHPLERPEWMKVKSPELKPTKILRSMLPVGMVLTGKDSEPTNDNGST